MRRQARRFAGRVKRSAVIPHGGMPGKPGPAQNGSWRADRAQGGKQSAPLYGLMSMPLQNRTVLLKIRPEQLFAIKKRYEHMDMIRRTSTIMRTLLYQSCWFDNYGTALSFA